MNSQNVANFKIKTLHSVFNKFLILAVLDSLFYREKMSIYLFMYSKSI